MNRSGVLTTKEEREEFVGQNYHTPQEECVVIARLDSPQKGDIDFAHDVQEGSWWKCTIKATKSKRFKWYSAELIEQK